MPGGTTEIPGVFHCMARLSPNVTRLSIALFSLSMNVRDYGERVSRIVQYSDVPDSQNAL
jgi:hypothetical protein